MSFAHLPVVLAALDDLAKRFGAAGQRLYLVGGIVRDQMLDQPLGASADIDLTTDARPDQTKAIVSPVADALWTQGERFGTIGLKHRGHAIEITTHRAESYHPQSRKPSVAFGDSIKVDLSRRDFTINAMAIELPDGQLVDPWGGQADLGASRLRTPLTPEISFSDDPLRMLRAARFIARFELEPTPELVAASTRMGSRLDIVAIERIGVEIERLLDLSRPGPGLEFLAQTGIVEVLVDRAGGPPRTQRANVQRAVQAASSGLADWRSRLAVLLVALVQEPTGADPATVEQVTVLGQGLRLATTDLRVVTALARGGLSLGASDGTEPALRRWILDTADRSGSAAVARALADDPGRIDGLAKAADSLAEAENLDEVEILGGASVMAALDTDAGPWIGQAIAYLRELVVAGGPMDPANQIDALRQWWARQGR